MVPLPGYHPEAFPFFIAKTMRSLSLVDFKQKKVHTLKETLDMPVDCYGYRKMCLSTTGDGRLKVMFVTSDSLMQNTVVEEIILQRCFMKALSYAGTRS